MNYQNNRQSLKEFALEIYKIMRDKGLPIFLCVGSDKFVCDSLGPIVAEKLRHEYKIESFVYGGIDYNINAINLMEVVNYIDTIHEGRHVILIDATFGENIGQIVVNDGAFAGMGKCLPIKKIGGTSILGVIGNKGRKFNLNSTRLGNVINIADFISKGCAMAYFVYCKMDKPKSNESVCC